MPICYYIFNALPYSLNFSYLLLIFALKQNVHKNINRQQPPYLLMFTGGYIIMYSLLPFKKDMFILPALPYLILIIADYIKTKMIKAPKYMIMFIGVIIFYELFLYACFLLFQDGRLTPYLDILRNDPNPH